MTLRRLVHALALVTAASSAFAVDIVLSPPAGGGVAVTNAAGNATQLRVADDGTTISGNLNLPLSSATGGVIMNGLQRFIHAYGGSNTFIGQEAGNFTMSGSGNTASGALALFANTSGTFNTASGFRALHGNTSGVFNTASGNAALGANANGSSNTANGNSALAANTTGNSNTAIGDGALQFSTTGSTNIAIGYLAGRALTTGSNNIDIGHQGVAGESGTIRIGDPAVHANTYVAGNVTVDSAKAINFGATTRQMLNLWSTTHAIGVQDNTQYFRTDYAYAWYQGGVHSNTQLAPGAGGVALMTLHPAISPPLAPPPVVGVVRAQIITATSDRDAKEDFAAVDGRQVLAALVEMPLHTWKYRNEDAVVRHIGPTAQDFRANFGVGYDDKTIATVDADGVALAAIQGLNAKLEERDAATQQQLRDKDATIAAQAGRVAQLERDRRLLAVELDVLKVAVSEIADLKRQTAHLARMIDRSRNGVDFVSSNVSRECTAEWAGCGTRGVHATVD